jgi:hypothetical protein
MSEALALVNAKAEEIVAAWKKMEKEQKMPKSTTIYRKIK